MELIFNSFWFIAIIVTLVNAVILSKRYKQFYQEKPELEEGYKSYLRGFVLVSTIPWIIMGMGSAMGYTTSVFDYLHPTLDNPAVIALHLVWFILLGLGVLWIYFRGGAEFFEKHSGIIVIRARGFGNEISNNQLTAKQIKILWGIITFGNVLGLVIMWVMSYREL